MRKSLLEKLREAKAGVGGPQVQLSSVDDLYALLLGGPMNPTQRRFIYGRERIRGYKGPAGCAKTSTLAALGWGRALLAPGSKIFISRQDYNDIMLTTLDEVTKMLGKLPKGTLLDRDKSPPMTWYVKPVTVENVSTMHDADVSQFTFMGLKDGLGSIQATCWLVDEADEVEEKRIHEINTRLRAPGNPEDYLLGCVFNPPDKHHWLYTACTGRNHEERKIAEPYMALYEPQPKENVQNLPPNYYEQLTKSIPEDMRQRLVDGLWGATFDGKPVYREFKRSFHARSDLRRFYDDTRPLFGFWDFGYRRPAFQLAQVDHLGILRHFHEVLGENEEAKPFARRVKAKLKEWFPNHREGFIHYGDPAVRQKKDTGQTLADLHSEGIPILYKISTIEHGLKVMRLLLEQVIQGEPAVQWDLKGCPISVQAMSGGYRMDDNGLKPKKDGFYDHLMDADRYGVDNLFSGTMATKAVNHMGPMPDSVEYDPNFDRG